MRSSVYGHLFLKACGFLIMASLLGAPTCTQNFGPIDTGNGPVDKTYHAFGDSIPAGYVDGFTPGQSKSYVGYYADDAAADRNWTITYRGTTTSGETTPQINSRMNSNLSRLRESDIFTWDGGGNDFLDARSNFYGNCNVGALDAALDTWRANWDAVLNTVENNVGTQAASAPLIRTMNVYYPNPDENRANFCGNQSQFEILLPRLLAAGDYMCATAEDRGWRCADTFAPMNCNEDANGNPAFNCPNKRYIQNLVDSGICPRNLNGPYASSTIDPACITAHLNNTGDWSNLRDPRSVNKNGSNRNLIQGDRTHPNGEGHDRIGAAHHQTGYDDVDGAHAEGSYGLCIDYQDNDNDGFADCDDADCAAFCN